MQRFNINDIEDDSIKNQILENGFAIEVKEPTDEQRRNRTISIDVYYQERLENTQ